MEKRKEIDSSEQCLPLRCVNKLFFLLVSLAELRFFFFATATNRNISHFENTNTVPTQYMVHTFSVFSFFYTSIIPYTFD